MISARFKAIIAVLISICLVAQLNAQKTPNQILQGVHQKLMKVKDYTADANIKTDISLIKILPVSAKIYFKQPDKFKVESPGIAILPKQGFTDFSKIIRDSTTYTAVLTGKETLRGVPVKALNVIPAVDTADLILAKLWIDDAKSLIMKAQLTTRSSGTMLIEYTYAAQQAYGLPDNMVFTVDVKKFKIPKGLATDIGKSSTNTADTKTASKGQILIDLSNYKVNKGGIDAVFKK
jgi:hypothetical protein